MTHIRITTPMQPTGMRAQVDRNAEVLVAGVLACATVGFMTITYLACKAISAVGTAIYQALFAKEQKPVAPQVVPLEDYQEIWNQISIQFETSKRFLLCCSTDLFSSIESINYYQVSTELEKFAKDLYTAGLATKGSLSGSHFLTNKAKEVIKMCVKKDDTGEIVLNKLPNRLNDSELSIQRTKIEMLSKKGIYNKLEKLCSTLEGRKLLKDLSLFLEKYGFVMRKALVEKEDLFIASKGLFDSNANTTAKVANMFRKYVHIEYGAHAVYDSGAVQLDQRDDESVQSEEIEEDADQALQFGQMNDWLEPLPLRRSQSY